MAIHPIPGSAEVLSGRDTPDVKTEISVEKREKTEAASSLGSTCSNSTVASAKLEFRNVAVPLGSDTLIAESQADPCEKSLLRSSSGSSVKVSEEEPCRTRRLATSAVTLETSSSVSSLCQGDGAGVGLQGPSSVSEQAVGRQGNESYNGSKAETGICEEPSPREGKEASPAADTSSPSKDSALSVDVCDVFDESLNRETHNSCMLGLDNVSTCSTNSEELDENSSHILGSNSSLHKAVQKPTKNENSGKASRFLVFSKMTSFRKTKPASLENQGSSSLFGSKAKIEELDAGKDDEDTASLLSFKSCSSGLVFHRKESYTSEYSDDDDFFYERPSSGSIC